MDIDSLALETTNKILSESVKSSLSPTQYKAKVQCHIIDALRQQIAKPAVEVEIVKTLRDILNGDARNIATADKCEHGKYGYEDCEACIVEFADRAITAYDAANEQEKG